MIVFKAIKNIKALFREMMRYIFSPLKACKNWMTAYRKHLFSAIEIRRYGLADPVKGNDLIRKYVSKEMADRFYREYNPQESISTISDKSNFASLCLKKNFPAPKTFGLYIDGEVNIVNGANHQSPEALIKFIQLLLPNEYLIKPNNGMLGKGLSVFEKNIDGQIFYQDKTLTVEEFTSQIKTMEVNNVNSITEDGQIFRGLLFQERIENHPEIAKLTGFRMLQTLRICTFVTAENKVEILFGFLKLAGCEGLADGFNLGKSGNMLASIDLSSGKITKIYSMNLKQNYFITVKNHPATGVKLEGFTIPYWQDCLDLAKELAKSFVPLRAVGWDIAITDNGPMVLEGNEDWVPVVPFYMPYDDLKAFGLKK